MRPSAIVAMLTATAVSLCAFPALGEWPHDPSVNLCICGEDHDQCNVVVASDGSGGAFAVWMDKRSGSYDIYAQHVDCWGEVIWAADGVPVCSASGSQYYPQIVSDEAGGAIVVWEDQRSGTWDVYAQRFGPSGTAEWAMNGVVVCAAAGDQTEIKAAPDGQGGVVVAWTDGRVSGSDIYAQHVNSAGTPQWDPDGVVVCGASETQSSPALLVTSSGNSIVAWQDDRTGDWDIRAQMIDPSGVAQWTTDGLLVSGETDDQHLPEVASDGLGGAVVVWRDDRNGLADVYAQRIDRGGDVLWTTDGAPVCDHTGHQYYHQVVSCGTDGIIVVWEDWRDVVSSFKTDIYAQLVDGSGACQWAAGGTPVCVVSDYQYLPVIASDGAGGSVVCWVDSRGADWDIYAQHLDATGNSLWTENGSLVCSADGLQNWPVITADGSGGAVMAWYDNRPSAGLYGDVYAQRITRGEYLGYPAATITEIADHPNDQGGVAVVSWAPSYLDKYPHEVVMLYSLWMRIPDERAEASSEWLTGIACTSPAPSYSEYLERSGWALVDQVAARYLDEYALHAPTYGDSTGEGTPLTEYMVMAETDDQWTFWVSAPASGYSVDNLAPGAPLDLEAEAVGSDAVLSWSPSGYHDEDLAQYFVYRSESSGFVPSEATRVGAVDDTLFVDIEPGPTTWYFVATAGDAHGNESPPSNEALVALGTGVDDGPLPAGLVLRGNTPNPFNPSTEISFDIPERTAVLLEVYTVGGRRVATLLDRVLEPGRHHVSWSGTDDEGVALPSLSLIHI